MLTQETLKQTPLVNAHRDLNARLVPFGGWEMPVQYDGIIAEYEYTRQQAAIFDICHMGEFIVEGDCEKSGLNRIITAKINDCPIKSCRYGAILNEQGGVIDDLIVFRIEQDRWMVVVNGATTEKDAQHFQKHLINKEIFTDISSCIGKLDIQGPLAREVLKPLVEGIDKLEYYTFNEFKVLGEDAIVSRTGYTGELGYEIYYPWEKTEHLWKELLKNDKVKPAGLGARDVLRLEMGYSLYGHELEENISPLEAGLKRFIDFDKDFIGKEALLQQQQQGVKRKIVSLVSDSRRSPREGHHIYTQDGQQIGVITSGSYSPCMERGIGLGFVQSGSVKKDDTVQFGNEKNKENAQIVSRPFYKNGSLKN